MIINTSLSLIILSLCLIAVMILYFINHLVGVIRKQIGINYNQFIIFSIILASVKMFDLLTTKMFVGFYGIEQEANVIARDFMNNLGVNGGLITLYLIAVILMTVLMFTICSQYKIGNKENIISKTTKWFIFLMLAISQFLVAIWNSLNEQESLWLVNHLPIIQSMFKLLFNN